MARRKILVADLLCGAGGSSTGCARALRELGLEMELVCLNHWPVAIETHQRNHPEARHYCQDISAVRPHLIVPEGYLDLLMASPTCTHHSVARGGKPTSDQQRSDPWHIITWLTELRVKRIIIENVWEFIGWGPVDARTGKPIKSRKGEYFRAWIDTIRRLGFDPEWRKLNAADYGDATTRQRFILMARSDGKSVSWPIPTHRRGGGEDELSLFPTVKPWRPAREIIDWSIRGRSILNRPKPLAPKTLARILAGAVKFGWPEVFILLLIGEIERSLLFHIRWAFTARNAPAKRSGRLKRLALVRDLIARLRHFRVEPMAFAKGGRLADPMVVTLRRNADGRDVGRPLPAIAAHGNHVGLAEPVIFANRNNNAPRTSDAPAPVFTTAPGGGVAIAEPVIVNMKKATAPSSADAPLPTQTSVASHVAVAEAIVLSQQNSGAPRSADDPLPTITTGGAGAGDHVGCARPILVEPFIATVAHGNSEGDATADSRRCHSADEPLGTMHAGGGKFAVVEPFVLSQASGGAPRKVAEPLPTIVTGGQLGSGTALIAPYYGSGSGETCQSAEAPLPTVTSKDRLGLVVPVTHSQGGNASRSVEEPIQTVTTAKGGEFALVMPVTHRDGSDRVRDAEEPLPTVTGANRGELAFITAQHGERPGQAPRVHAIDQPAPTIAATGHVDLVEATPGYDILFRMLEPHELAAAMGFTSEDQAYEFAGTKTEKVKQIGNAVSVAKMKACVGAIMADAAPRQTAAPARATRAA